MKKLLIFLLFLFFSNSPIIQAEDRVLIFNDINIVVFDLQDLSNYKISNPLLKEKISILGDKVIKLEESIKLVEEENLNYINQISLWGEMINSKDDLIKEQDRNIRDLGIVIENQEEVIKNCQPGFWEKLKDNIMIFGSGAGVGFILKILIIF